MRNQLSDVIRKRLHLKQFKDDLRQRRYRKNPIKIHTRRASNKNYYHLILLYFISEYSEMNKVWLVYRTTETPRYPKGNKKRKKETSIERGNEWKKERKIINFLLLQSLPSNGKILN
jgi:hypothetical protein